jgi:hypothetical protein
MRFLFVLIIIFILILVGQKYLAYFNIFRLKKKIKNNPSIGIKQQDNSYDYKEEGYTISYRVKESPLGVKAVEWFFLKRRLTFIEEKILDIKRSLDKFFLYQRWVTLFRPSAIIVLMVSLIIFYLGIMEQSSKRIEHFKWIVARMTGISPKSIGYSGAGWFNISGQKRSAEGEVEPVKISFNPLSWLFFSDTANVSFWSNKLNRYLSYPLTINDKGDVWLNKKSEQIHGRVLSDKVVWDEPQRTGIRSKVSGHRIAIKDGKLKIFDE